MANVKFHSVLKYLLFFALIFMLATIVEGVEGFDLHRCYEQASIYAEQFSVVEMIIARMLKSIDFVYYLIHYYANVLSIPPNFVTASIVIVYYLLIILAMKREFAGNIQNLFYIVVLFTVPVIYVISISRNLTAIMFLYCAILSLYNKHYVIGALFTIISIFTHITILIYVAIILISFFLRQRQINNNTLYSIIVITFLISIISPTIIRDFIFKLIGGHGLDYYENAYSGEAAVNFLFRGSINYADKLPVIYAYFFSVALLCLNRIRSFEFWTLLLLTVLLSFFMNSSFSLVNRCMMFMPIFWGLNVCKILKTSPKSKTFLQIICYIGLFVLVLHIYGYRHIYFALI